MRFIGKFFAFDEGMPLFNALALGERLYKLTTAKFNFKELETSLGLRFETYFDTFNRLEVQQTS